MLKRTEREIIFDIPELKDTTIILDYLTTILKRRYNDFNKAVNDDKKNVDLKQISNVKHGKLSPKLPIF